MLQLCYRNIHGVLKQFSSLEHFHRNCFRAILNVLQMIISKLLMAVLWRRLSSSKPEQFCSSYLLEFQASYWRNCLLAVLRGLNAFLVFVTQNVHTVLYSSLIKHNITTVMTCIAQLISTHGFCFTSTRMSILCHVNACHNINSSRKQRNFTT